MGTMKKWGFEVILEEKSTLNILKNAIFFRILKRLKCRFLGN